MCIKERELVLGMNQIQSKLLEMMEWFHQFCVENDLRYYALGGTMLGAKRHEGFIPWDDDIDLGMPRSDYQKLESIMKSMGASRYVIETPNTTASDYFYPYAKLYDTTTTLIENLKYRIIRGVFIDIFPLDGLGESLEEAENNYKKVERKRNLLLMKTSGIRKGRSFYKNLSVILAKFLPVNEKKLLHEVAEKANVFSFDEVAYGGNALGAWRFKEIMPTRFMGKPKLYHFESIQIFGAEHADEYLTKLYGDWRQLPPEEKRITHHDFVECDLAHSWLERDTKNL